MEALLDKAKRQELYDLAQVNEWTPGAMAIALGTLPSTLDAAVNRGSKKGIVGDLDRWLLENAHKKPVEYHATKKELGKHRAKDQLELYSRESAHIDRLVRLIRAALPVLEDHEISPLERLDLMEVNLKTALALAPSIREAIHRVRETPHD